MKPRIVLIDLDNTLYNYHKVHSIALENVKNKAKIMFNIDSQEFDYLYNRSNKEIKSRLINTASSHNRLLYFQKFFEIKGLGQQVYYALELERTYWNIFLMHMKLNENVNEFLDELRLRDIKIGLVTDLTIDIQFRKLIRLGIEDKFDAITTSEEVGADKPFDDCFTLTLKKMDYKDLSDDEIWMIGDDYDKDILGAVNSIGAKGFLYTNEKSKSSNRVSSAIKFDNFSYLINILNA